MAKKAMDKINDWFGRAGIATKLSVGGVTVLGLIYGMAMYPTNVRLNALEKSDTEIKKTLREKVDTKTLEIYLESIEKKLDELSDGMKHLIWREVKHE